jgi:DNA-binding IclR family transcriptional regulator
VSISGTTARITEERIPLLARMVQDTTHKISLRLGYPTSPTAAPTSRK